MKISNETKIGSLTAIAIATLILGFNFLKGKSLRPGGKTVVYTEFQNVEGLTTSSPVSINGLPVGKVTSLQEKDKKLSAIIVGITLEKDILIPNNSEVVMNSALLGNNSLSIVLGNSSDYIQSGQTLVSRPYMQMFDKLQGSVDPALQALTVTLHTVDTVMHQLSAVLDPGTQNNLKSIVANLQRTSISLQNMMSQNGDLQKTLANIEKISSGLQQKQAEIDRMITNFTHTSDKLAQAPIDATIQKLEAAVASFNDIAAKMNSKEGSLGLLINDKKLYEEIRQTNRSLNTLLDDFRLHPKRYVSLSVFGKKDKTGPITAPVYDSTSTQ